MRALARRLVPQRIRVRLRALIEGRRLDAGDVAAVRAVTAEQWRTVGTRAPHHAADYWGGIDDPAATTVAGRRSEWMAALQPFRESTSALELGCNVGRNLFALQQRYPALALAGLDIDPEAIALARARVRGDFAIGNLYDVTAALGDRTADVVFTMGVLIHLHPDTLPPLLEAMLARARRFVVLVEQVSADNRVMKGPAAWNPERRATGDYIQWSPDLPGMLRSLGVSYALSDVPLELQANGARHLIVVEREGVRP